MVKYQFQKWEDGPITATRTITLNSDLTLTCIYEEVSEISNVTFTGSVSEQAQIGETITLTITKPDSTQDIFTATTLADKTFTTTRTYNIAGAYTVVAHIDADEQYIAADSATIPFTIALQDRTITVNVSVA